MTGRGRILVRAKAEIELDDNGREAIIIRTALSGEQGAADRAIADLVKEKAHRGVSPSCATGPTRTACDVVIECARTPLGEVLNNLYQQTQLQVVFGINMVALVDGQPRC